MKNPFRTRVRIVQLPSGKFDPHYRRWWMPVWNDPSSTAFDTQEEAAAWIGRYLLSNDVVKTFDSAAEALAWGRLRK
jgi:hypothetical protein